MYDLLKNPEIAPLKVNTYGSKPHAVTAVGSVSTAKEFTGQRQSLQSNRLGISLVSKLKLTGGNDGLQTSR